MLDYDVIIVGAGAGGGVAAGVLAEAGKSVLLLERGDDLSTEAVGRDHLRNQRISLYGHNAGPDIDGNPRVFVSPNGHEQTVRPHEGGYNNNASCVGGGTRVYGAQCWRFHPNDFRMATKYGIPEGSSLADWPISYDDLAPFYEQAEWEIGVCGDDTQYRNSGARSKPYPMPKFSDTIQRTTLLRGANALGWSTHPVPLAMNSVPRDGREACARCQHCVGFACPTNAKNGTQNTMIPRALATGNCTLITRAVCERVETNALGEVTGVTYLTTENSATIRRTVKSKAVVVAAGAIESARLLQLSKCDKHSQGLGNRHDQVGRHLQGHYYPGAHGLFEELVFDGIGPGPSISTTDFSHDNPGIIGGGMLADEFIKLPIISWYRSLPPELPRWGVANKIWMRENFGKVLQLMGPVQDIPSPNARVTLDGTVKDHWGIPVARLSGTTHPETVRTAAFMRQKAIDWLQASGAIQIWYAEGGLGLSGGQHQAGTCRMGNDPKTSVTDSLGRVHDHDNLYVMDASVHVTNGGFNPVLTLMALAFRNAAELVKRI